MNRKRKKIIAASEVSEIRTYTLGGRPQKVMLDGKSRSNPVVLFLHGGPGSPIPFCEGCRGMFPEITARCTMVYWDQLGCGINNCVIDDSFAIDDYVGMTVELIRELKKEFPETTVNLLGVSWGSILAAKAAERVPELINRVVTYGQVVRELGFGSEVFDALEASSMPKRLKRRAGAIKECGSRSLRDMKKLMGWIGKYTEGYICKSGGNAPMGEIIRGLLSSPDYSIKDFKAVAINGYKNNKSLITELISLDISDVLINMRVPYLIMQGETDIVTSTSAVSSLIEKSQNPNLRFCMVENSGHIPGAHGMDKIINDGFAFLEGAGEMIKLRKYTPEDCPALAELFYSTVHTVNSADYSKEELDAWADGKVNLSEWDKSLRSHNTVIAEASCGIVGFGDMDENGYLDRLYVRWDYQRKGTAGAIVSELERHAAARGVRRFSTHASITALPFFEKQGYRRVRENTVVRAGIELVNFIMEKEI